MIQDLPEASPQTDVNIPPDWASMQYGALVSVRDSYRCELLNTRHSLYSYRNSTATLEDSRHQFRITERNFEKKILKQQTLILFLNLMIDERIEVEALGQAQLLFYMTTH